MIQSPYLNIRETAVYLRLVDDNGQPQARAALEFVNRWKVKTKKRGHAVLVNLESLEATLQERS